MGITSAREFLLWCTVINFGLLVVWFLASTLARGGLLRLWSHWFHLPAETFDTVNVGGMALYKMAVLFFNLVPLIALYLVR
ncbi:DUF6868 family protein [Singulisphaera acidiphila]|uniref:DUF6868 domain-containing protein n=1 Tax=Singulisphaera acidiphila (strain ATCC BAA-1392 / DSM 18658 / VKM B-2454 / MOB10) TaxID=886293 RepID=L0D6J4_SINAD|nr:hypothetical protein [Singulisphaera acidiphila]AGA24485.1 hypothetical protein Sinac_0021 [Singulisphaera acidiphila DSM 18658]